MFYYDFEGAVCFRYRNAENSQQKRKMQENPLDCPPKRLFLMTEQRVL